MNMIGVQVTDDNDNAPVFVHPRPSTNRGVGTTSESLVSSSPTAAASTIAVGANTVIQIWNRASSGYVVTTVRAEDADIGENAKLDYIITAGNSDGLLRLDKTHGTMSIARDLRGDVDNGVTKQRLQFYSNHQIKPLY